MGVRSGETSCGALTPSARFFEAEDFTTGAELCLEHMPHLRFLLGEPDSFTAAFMAASQLATEAGGSGSPLDVYVPENNHPVPSLPLEAVKNDGSNNVDATAHSKLSQAALLVAKVLAGVSKSAYALIRQGDKRDRGCAPIEAVANALASFGVAEPAVAHETIAALLTAFTLGPDGRISKEGALIHSASSGKDTPSKKDEATWQPVTVGGTTLDRAGAAVDALNRAKGVGSSGSPTSSAAAPQKRSVSGTTIGTLDDPLAGPFLRDYASADYAGVTMVDYRALFASLHHASVRQQALQPRMDKILSQLRAALLSSRGHLRKVSWNG